MSFTPNTPAQASDFISTSAGAADSGKAPILNGSGVLDTSFLTFKGAINSGQTTKNLADASTTQTIAHGLGFPPKLVTLKIVYNSQPSGGGSIITTTADVVYSNSTQSTITSFVQTGDGSSSSTGIIYTTLRFTVGASNEQTGVVTGDVTNISIAWTKSGLPTGTAYILWSAIA